MTEFTGVSIMMGAVDETDSIRETVKTILGICDHKDLREIIIGYSQHVTKESRAVVDELVSNQGDVPIVAFEQKRKGISGLVDMIEAARGSHCILVASDMAQDLKPIAGMIEGAKLEGDTIFTSSRWIEKGSFHNYGRVRYVINFSAQLVMRILFRSRMTDFTNPVQIAPAELYKAIEYENEGFPILLELVLKPLRLGYKFKEIPTSCFERTQGKSNNSFRQTAMYAPVVLHIRFMKKRDILKKDSALYTKLFGSK